MKTQHLCQRKDLYLLLPGSKIIRFCQRKLVLRYSFSMQDDTGYLGFCASILKIVCIVFTFCSFIKALSFTLNMVFLKHSFKSLNQLSQHPHLTFSHPFQFRNPITKASTNKKTCASFQSPSSSRFLSIVRSFINTDEFTYAHFVLPPTQSCLPKQLFSLRKTITIMLPFSSRKGHSHLY